MNKYSALFCFALLFNYTLCLTCTGEEDECKKDNIDQSQKDNYACVPIDEETCGLKPFCNYAVKEQNDENFKCSDYPSQTDGKLCTDNNAGDAESACKEEYECDSVPAPTSEEGQEPPSVNCASYPVTDKKKYKCISGSEKTCTKEEYTCETVPKLDGIDCSTYSVGDETENYCGENDESAEGDEETHGCKKIPYCTHATEGECTSYQVDSTKSTTHTCVKGREGETYCVEKYICGEFTKVAKQTETGIKCSDLILSNENKDKGTHVCIDDEEENSSKACKEEYLCSKAPKIDGITCTNLIVSDDRKYNSGCKPTTDSDPDEVKQYACKEVEYLCEEVPKFQGEGEAPFECSLFDVDDDKRETHICTEDPTSQTKQCKEIKYCSDVEAADMTSETNCETDFWYDKNTKICKKNTETNICEELEKETPTPTPTESCNMIPNDDDRECINIQSSDANHICVDNTGGSTKCIEKLLCSKVPKPADNTDSVDCSSTNYQVSEEHKNTHICIQDLESQNYACKEEYLCSQATGTNNEECSKFPVNPTNILTHGCIKDTGNQNKCKEESLCTRVTLASATDELCNNYPVDINKLNTHICIKSDDTTCKEESLCENVGKGANIICSNYPVKKENKATHGCIESRNPEKACQEEKFCASVTDGTSDEQCRRYPVSYENMDKKVCIKNQNDNTMGCIEKELCTTITKGDGIDCSKYPVSNDKMKTHLCRDVEGNEKCSEVEIDCSTAEKGETDEQCSYYKVSNPNKNCVKNTDTSAGAKPCKEVSKNECELKTSGATDDNSCKDLAVDKADEQICRKNPEGDNCVQLTYCEYGIGLDDYDCAKYTLKDSEKICKKKASENKCEEVTKTDDEQPGSGDDNGNGGKNGNSGSFLNVAFGLLFIISLV